MDKSCGYCHDNASDDKIHVTLVMPTFTVAEIVTSWIPANLISVQNLRQNGFLTKIAATFATILNLELRFPRPSAWVISKKVPKISSKLYLTKNLDYATTLMPQITFRKITHKSHYLEWN